MFSFPSDKRVPSNPSSDLTTTSSSPTSSPLQTNHPPRFPPWLRIQQPSGPISYPGKAPAKGGAQPGAWHSRCIGVKDLATVIYHPLNVIHLVKQLNVAWDFSHHTALRVSSKPVIQQKTLLSFPLKLATKPGVPCLGCKSRMGDLERRRTHSGWGERLGQSGCSGNNEWLPDIKMDFDATVNKTVLYQHGYSTKYRMEKQSHGN